MRSTSLIPREFVARYDRPGPRYTSYPTVPAWTQSFGEVEYRAALAEVWARTSDTLSLYVHLPFCAERCHYCGCNAVVTRQRSVVDNYLDRLERELDMVLAILGPGREVVQLHWGGGTPNFLDQAQRHRLVNRLTKEFRISETAERSIELDPRLVKPGQIADLRALGFNRISLGVQDLDPAVQAAIGRMQPFQLVETVVDEIREAGFESLNLDLIYGLPRQSVSGFRGTLERVAALNPDRLAVFGYAHVPSVKPNQKQINQAELPGRDIKFRLFETAVNDLGEAGYQWVGLDHFARPTDELAIAADERRLHRNFMGYTLRPADHMLALGMSGIGDLAGRFVQLDPKLGDYSRAVDAGRLPVVKGHHLSLDDRRRRTIITHLMCNLELPYGLPLEGGETAGSLLGSELDRFQQHADAGLVELEPERIAVTAIGRYFLRNLCMELDAHLDRATARAVFSRTV